VLNTYSEVSKMNLADVSDRNQSHLGKRDGQRDRGQKRSRTRRVFHLAAHINVDESLKDPLVFVQANIFGMYNVLEAVRKHGSRLILTSSCEVYGDGHELKKGENFPKHPN